MNAALDTMSQSQLSQDLLPNMGAVAGQAMELEETQMEGANNHAEEGGDELLNDSFGAGDEDGDAEAVDEPAIVDTTNVTEIAKFVSDVDACEPGEEGAKIFHDLIASLPTINGKLGRNQGKGRVAKVLKKYKHIEEAFKTHVSRWNLADTAKFFSGIKLSFDIQIQHTIIKMALTSVFKDELNKQGASNASASRVDDNCAFNQVALMAQMVIHKNCEPFWAQLAAGADAENRPAYLESVERPADLILQQLISIGVW